jgi:hypothetical protein
MSVRSEIQIAGWRLTRRLPAKSTLHIALSSARDLDPILVLAFAAVGLLLTVLSPLSAETAMQLAQML